jgi:hypothetical protein
MHLSVIICTHNPRKDYLTRTLDALKAQTLPREQWELLLVDNASAEPLAGQRDLSWHPGARHIREETLGLTPARLRGIREARAELLVFVDDDNVLAPDYLAVASAIGEQWPTLGAWSGSVIPEFETPPPAELQPYLWCLCIRPVEKDNWSSFMDPKSCPWGAGMCVRATVARRYSEKAGHNAQHALLGRRGKELGSAEDLDLATTSYESGLGTGLFAKLKLTHLIPSSRLKLDYLLNLISDSAASHAIFTHLLGEKFLAPVSRIDRLVAFYKYLRATPLQRQVERAHQKGMAKARAILSDNKNEPR